MFSGAYVRPGGGLYSAFNVHEHFRVGDAGPDLTVFGDWRYSQFTVYWPLGTSPFDELEYFIGAEDGPDSTAVAAAYPDASY
jgi:hypothetical protein